MKEVFPNKDAHLSTPQKNESGVDVFVKTRFKNA
jgi:hypothetical protein